jgi:two-component system, OmpR family, sensor kinase
MHRHDVPGDFHPHGHHGDFHPHGHHGDFHPHGHHGWHGMRGPHSRVYHRPHGHHGWWGMRRFVGARLHRRIFVWFGVSILVAAAVSAAVWQALPDETWQREVARVQRFVGNRFAAVWGDERARAELARAMATDLELTVTLSDAQGAVLAHAGAACTGHVYRAAVLPGPSAPGTPGTRSPLGAIEVCRDHPRGHGALVLVAIGTAALCLWLGAGLIARRLVRPLGELVRVARDIGAGKLQSRMRIGWHGSGEIGILGAAINDMAGRIEKQMADQRELLAAVSHEIRTPLGHMRVLIEMARDTAAASRGAAPGVAPGAAPRATNDSGARYLDELEREVLSVDSLVGQLLASSRLEFDAIERRPLDARTLASEALSRAGLDPGCLHVELGDTGAMADTLVQGDPTLLARALANLIENAQTHGGGVTALRIRAGLADGADAAVDAGADARIDFEVEDQGPGFGEDEPEKLFESFYRGRSGKAGGHAALGLGLALVRRIARAHGGDAWAASRAGGGARVGFSMTRHATIAPAPAAAGRGMPGV